MGDPIWPPDRRARASGHRRRIRGQPAALLSCHAYPGASDHRAPDGHPQRHWRGDLKAPSGTAPDLEPRTLCRGRRTGAAGRAHERALHHGRRHQRPPCPARGGDHAHRRRALHGLPDWLLEVAPDLSVALAGPVIDRLMAHPARSFPNQAAWLAHLSVLGIDTLNVTPPPVTVASEGALWGAIRHHGLPGKAGIVSDDGGQFRVGVHALCWVHAERLVHTLVPTTRVQAQALETTRQLIWWFYRDLKAWKRDPCPRRASALRARFDRIFTRQTGSIMLDRLLARLHRRKRELLRVLERPEIPLHTNASENDIRACVIKRKISGGTMSDAGREARDVMLGLMKTCMKLGVSFFAYLGDRLGLNTTGSQ